MTGVQELIDRSIPFLEVVKNRTAGAEWNTAQRDVRTRQRAVTTTWPA